MSFLFKKILLFSILININHLRSFDDIQNLREIIPLVLNKYETMGLKIHFLDQIKAKFSACKSENFSQIFCEKELDFLAHEFCKFMNNSHVVIIWPKALQSFKYITDEINQFGKVIYARKINLKNKALPYLIQNIPEKADNVAFHLEQYFNNQSSGNVIAVLCTFPDLATAVKCKLTIRQHLNLNPPMSTLHIADTQEQSIMLAQIVFNQNTINYLNSSLPFSKYEKFNFLFKQYKEIINNLNFDQDLFCVDGSSILAMHGIRDINVDFDFLSYFPQLDLPPTKYKLDALELGPMDVHNQAWINAHVNPIETIFDPNYYFYYEGFKFTTLERIRLFKFNQNRELDQKDVKEIDQLLKEFNYVS